MINRKFLIILICTLYVLSPPLKALEVKKQKRLDFTVIKIPGESSVDPILDEISLVIKKKLKDEKFFVINDLYNPDSDITFQNCIKKQCTLELPNAAAEGVVVLIAVKGVTVKTGRRQLSRYVEEDITETRYTLYVSTAEILKENYDLEFKDTFMGKAKLLNKADLIGKDIRDYYLKRKPVSFNKEAKTAETREPSRYYDITGVSLNVSRLRPMGSFKEITDTGYGGSITLNGALPALRDLTLNPGLYFYSLRSSGNKIDSGYMILPEIVSGYNFVIDEELGFSPFIGAGYSMMFAYNTPGGGAGSADKDFYYNPFLKAGIEGSYSLTGDFSLICSVTFNCLFGSDSLLYFRNFNLGIRMNL